MKKFLLFSCAIISICTAAKAQCFKYPLFEHFTQASCGPCAQQNPGFQSSIIAPNPNSVRHIAYHTSWPGIDPMYNFNASQSDDRVNYYNVSGVPDVYLQGNYKNSQPGGMTMGDVNAIISQTSPIKISVIDQDNGSDHDVTVTIKSVGTPPTGNFVLRSVIIERNVNYTNPPGNNGETYFPNVMRSVLPSSAGDVVTLASQGNEVVFNYQYIEDAIWDMAEIGVVSFLQNETNKEIINCGASFDEVQNAIVIPPSTIAKDGTVGNASSFSFTTGNGGSVPEDFIFTLTTDAPNDWSASFNVDGSTYSGSATISMAGSSNLNATIDVTPGATGAFASYALSIIPVSNPNAPAMLVQVYVISGITDLVINNAAGNGITPGDASYWQDVFIDGMNFAASTSYDVVFHNVAQRAMLDGALQGVEHLYLNIGWTFPGLEDAFVNQLQTFMYGGGNVMISGQDVAWETFDEVNSPYWSTLKQDFLNNYMNIGFVSDGNTANDPLTANMNDIFTIVPSADILPFYGTAYFYPDQITALNNAIPCFYYNSNTAKIAAVRSVGTGKTFFLGVGVEMIGTDADKNNIIKTTHDWFHGIISSAEFDVQLQAIAQNYPNPSGNITYLDIQESTSELFLTITDVLGRVVLNEKVTSGQVAIATALWESGTYFYSVSNGNETSKMKSMEVIH